VAVPVVQRFWWLGSRKQVGVEMPEVSRSKAGEKTSDLFRVRYRVHPVCLFLCLHLMKTTGDVDWAEFTLRMFYVFLFQVSLD
jgi:hypothetical protein